MSWMAEMTSYHRLGYLRRQATAQPPNDARDDHQDAHTSAPEQKAPPHVSNTENSRP